MPADDARAPLPFDIDHDLEQGKAFVRLRQAAIPVPEAFFTLRAGALVLQTVGSAILALALATAVVLAITDVVERTLDIPGYYLSVVAVVVGGGLGLFVLVAGELLTLQVVIARNTRLTTVILSEMNFAEASARQDLATRLVERAESIAAPVRQPAHDAPTHDRDPSPPPAEPVRPAPPDRASAASSMSEGTSQFESWFRNAQSEPDRTEGDV